MCCGVLCATKRLNKRIWWSIIEVEKSEVQPVNNIWNIVEKCSAGLLDCCFFSLLSCC